MQLGSRKSCNWSCLRFVECSLRVFPLLLSGTLQPWLNSLAPPSPSDAFTAIPFIPQADNNTSANGLELKCVTQRSCIQEHAVLLKLQVFVTSMNDTSHRLSLVVKHVAQHTTHLQLKRLVRLPD